MRTVNIITLSVTIIIAISCNSNKPYLQKVDMAWLDSIKAASDTMYTKNYRNDEFATATYFVNKKDSVVYQVMKDSKDVIRQILGVKKSIRLFTAEYFENGQLKASLLLDKDGKYHGNAITFHENGAVKSEGLYNHGLYKGHWKNYDVNGKLISIEVYDKNGQLIKTAIQ